jgi:hypothetical protein
MKWEYTLWKSNRLEKMLPEINALGTQGWEAVTFALGHAVGLSKGEHMVLLKRPVAA